MILRIHLLTAGEYARKIRKNDQKSIYLLVIFEPRLRIIIPSLFRVLNNRDFEKTFIDIICKGDFQYE